MNARERFLATIRFETTDRPFRWETPGIWASTIQRWAAEGLPEAVVNGKIPAADYFGMDHQEWLPFGRWVADPFCPYFEYLEIEDDGENIIARDTDGVIKKNKKLHKEMSMPQFLKFPVETRADYLKEILPRYDYRTVERFPENWKELATRYADRDYPVGMYVIGPFGHLRNLFGDENLMYMMFDDPSLINEIMENWCRFYEGFLPMVCKDVVPDMIMVWEDMCYRNGPLISPELYRQFMLPYLKRVINRANDLGIVGIIIDNDGNCTSMLPLYLEAGGNVFYPFECQAGMDIVKVREQYGSRFTIIGGIDKYLLSDEYGTSDIVAEIDRKMRPMMVPGGYIPMLDHSTPPNIPLANFETFLDYCRRLPEIMKSENSMEKRNHEECLGEVLSV